MLEENACTPKEIAENFQMECRYSAEQRKSMAVYYKELSKKMATGRISITSNPNDLLNKYMNDGTCITVQAGTEENVVVPKIVPNPAVSNDQRIFQLKDIKIGVDAKREKGSRVDYNNDGVVARKTYPVNVVISFSCNAAANILQYNPVKISTAKYNGGDLYVPWQDSMKERIDHNKVKDGFEVEIKLLSPVEKADKIIQLKGKLDVDIMNNEDIVILSDIESLLKNRRSKLNYPKLDKIGTVSIEQGDLTIDKNNEQNFTVSVRGSSFSGIDVRIIDVQGNTLEPSMTMENSSEKTNKRFVFQRPKENISDYQLKITPLTSIEIPFDLSNIDIKD